MSSFIKKCRQLEDELSFGDLIYKLVTIDNTATILENY